MLKRSRNSCLREEDVRFAAERSLHTVNSVVPRTCSGSGLPLTGRVRTFRDIPCPANKKKRKKGLRVCRLRSIGAIEGPSVSVLGLFRSERLRVEGCVFRGTPPRYYLDVARAHSTNPGAGRSISLSLSFS